MDLNRKKLGVNAISRRTLDISRFGVVVDMVENVIIVNQIFMNLKGLTHCKKQSEMISRNSRILRKIEVLQAE